MSRTCSTSRRRRLPITTVLRQANMVMLWATIRSAGTSPWVCAPGSNPARERERSMKFRKAAFLGVALGVIALGVQAQEEGGGRRGGAARPVTSEKFHSQYIRIGNQAEGLLYEPTGAAKRIALVFSHPDRNTFNQPLGREMSARGYRVLMVNYRGDASSPEANPEEYLPSISAGIAFLRSLPGTQRVVLVGHSGGGHLASLYDNVAEHGPSACQGAEKIYPCPAEGLANLAKPDGVILMDSTLGAFHQMSAVDPAVGTPARNAALDMFTAANGYDAEAKKATYSAAFAKRFYAAQ